MTNNTNSKSNSLIKKLLKITKYLSLIFLSIATAVGSFISYVAATKIFVCFWLIVLIGPIAILIIGMTNINMSSKYYKIVRKWLKIVKYLILIYVACATVFVLIITAITFHLDHFFKSKEERYFYDQLSEISRANVDRVMLKDLTNFDWEYVCEISAYDQTISKEDYEDIVGFEFDGNVPGNYGNSEDESLLLFISKKHRDSLLINADYLIERNNTRRLELCSHKTNIIVILNKSPHEYRQGFYKLTHKLTLENINQPVN